VAQYPQSAAAFGGYVNPLEYLSAAIKSRTNHKEFVAEVRSKSTVMKSRVINYAREHVTRMEETGKLKEGTQKFYEAAMWMQEVADFTTVSIGWKAIYDKELRAGKSETAAIEWADEIVLETQPNMKETELAPLFRGKDSFRKSMLRYGAPLNVVWNQLSYGIPNAMKQKNMRYIIGIYASMAVANMIVAALRGKIPLGEDDDDEEARIKKLAYYLIFSPIAESVPIVSGLAESIVESSIEGRKVPRFAPRYFPAAEYFGEALIDATAKEDYAKAAIDAATAFGYTSGLPVNQARKLILGVTGKSIGTATGIKPDF
jgi:hypothetical protein